jgi:hypothetical protein
MAIIAAQISDPNNQVTPQRLQHHLRNHLFVQN